MKNQENKPLLRNQPILVLSLAIFILIISGGYFYYRYEKKIIRQEKHNDLKTIADLKISQIVHWREQRLADAHVLAESPFIRQKFQQWLLSQDSTLEKDFLERFSLLKNNHKYEDVLIVSAGGKLLLGLDTNLKHIDSETIDYCKKALREKSIFLSDFYFCRTHHIIHFDVFAPILNDSNVPVAALVLRVNPFNYLYPLFQSWPTSSKSAETLIIRKDGDSILYVNDLRHISNTALRLRIPLSSIEVPAVQAVLGHTGIFEGIDYRGVRVLADVRPVTGSPWFMIAKVDQSEIFSEIKYRTVIVIIITLLLLLFSGIGISWLYNNRQINIYRKLLETGTAFKESQIEFRTTLYSIGDAVITTDIKGCIRNMNVVAERLTGWKESDGVGRKIGDVFHIVNEESGDKVESPVQRVLKEGLVEKLANHTLLISKDGKEIPIADSGAPIRNEKGDITGVVLVFRDQTREREAQKALQESERKFRETVTYLDEGYYSVTIDGILLDHNQAFNRILGIDSSKDMKGSRLPDFWQNPDERKLYLQELMTRGFIRNFLINAKTISGKKVVVLVNSHLVKDENDKLVRIEGTFTDFTELKRTEEQLRKLNRIYSLLSDINQAIVRSRVPEELYDKVCKIAVEQGGFGMAWIGLIDESSQKLQVIAQAGRTKDYLEQIDISLNGEPLTYCPIDSELRQGKHIICKINENEEMAPCRKIAYNLGFRSSASFPLKVSDVFKGTLTYYSDEPDFFDEAELKLLDELALDISFAMEYAGKEAGRKQAERQLRIYSETQSLLLHTNDLTEIYRLVAEKISELIGDGIVFTTLLDESSQTLGIVSYKGLNVPLEKLIRTLRIDPVKMVYHLKDITEDELRIYRSGKLEELDGGIYTLATRKIPKSLCKLAERMLKIEHVFIMGFIWKEVHFGGLVILAQSDLSLYKATIELLINQAVTSINRLRAETALQNSEEKFSVAFKTSPYAITITNPEDGRFIEVNNAFFSIAGYTTEEALNNSSIGMDLWVNMENRNHVVKALLGGGKVSGQEFQFKKKNGEIFTGWFSAHLIDIKSKTYILSSISDITGRKQALEEIKILNESLEQRVIERTAKLEAVNNELEAFSYSVSHDLRAPLRHVNGYVELLNKHFPSDLPEKGRHYLNSIADSVRIMGMLIDDLLQFSRTGRMEMHHSHCDMNEIVKEVKESLAKDNPDRKIEWVVGKLTSINGDEAMLRLVWINLLSNAVKFTRTRKKARIEIGVRKENKERVFYVRDNGVGFDMQYAQKLFGVFQRLHPTEEFEGTGIGLANVHRIILRHGGRTWAEAELDKGAVFYFSIPNK